MTDQTCLVRRLSAFIDLTEAEEDYIEDIEKDSRDVAPGDEIVDTSSREILVLNRGWARAIVKVRDRAQTVRLFVPGEIVGLAELGVRTSRHRVEMLTEGAVCPFDRDRIGDVIARLPRLAALFVTISGLDQVTLRDRLGATFAATAEQRLALFLLDLRSRLAVTGVGSGNRFRVPMTQDGIGSAIGTTSVTVNKSLKSLVSRGWLEIERPYYRILDRRAMEGFCDYENVYERLDMSWFPEPA